MEPTMPRWFPDPGMDLPIFHQGEMNSLDNFPTQDIWEMEYFSSSLSTEGYDSPSSFLPLARTTTSNTFSGSSVETSQTGCEGKLVSFGNSKEEVHGVGSCGLKRSYEAMESKTLNPAWSRPPPNNQDHIMAERRRREKLSEKFIALSAIVPGLKKMDKASVLGDAIKHMKQLQEKVKTLEDEAMKKRKVENAVLVKNSLIFPVDDDNSSCDENFNGQASFIPEIQVKLAEKTVLIRIHCKNYKGVIAKTIFEIENLHLTVMSTTAIVFTTSSLDVTVTAQMDEGFSLAAKEIVKKLSSVFRHLMQIEN